MIVQMQQFKLTSLQIPFARQSAFTYSQLISSSYHCLSSSITLQYEQQTIFRFPNFSISHQLANFSEDCKFDHLIQTPKTPKYKIQNPYNPCKIPNPLLWHPLSLHLLPHVAVCPSILRNNSVVVRVSSLYKSPSVMR